MTEFLDRILQRGIGIELLIKVRKVLKCVSLKTMAFFINLGWLVQTSSVSTLSLIVVICTRHNFVYHHWSFTMYINLSLTFTPCGQTK